MPIVKLLSEHFGNPQARELRWYRDHGGYEGARKALLEMNPDQVTQEVIASNLRGLGGAGFPTGRKWTFVPKDLDKPRYLVVNADEGEPGTFKDRYILELDPHRLIEGMLIASYAVGIHVAYIYIRGEYVRPYEILQKAIDDAYAEGLLGERILGKDFRLDIYVHRGAGAYICGEESALLESLEGKKGWPRLRPPFPAVKGVFACPTVIDNVETLSHLPKIILNGGPWFAEIGSPRNGGTRLFCLSGSVKKPGVYELAMGTPLRELIYEHGGGIIEDKQLKAVIPGGVSASILKADEIDVPMDFDSLMKIGSMAGSGGVVVMDEDVCIVKALGVVAHFFSHESCGQCTPCREGTGWVEKIVNRILAGAGHPPDLQNLLAMANNMTGTSICALSDAAAMPVKSYITKFRPEFEHHVRNKKCDLEERKAVAAGF